MTFSVDELLALLQEAQPGQDPNALTMRELAERTGRNKYSIANDLRPLIEAGKVAVIRQPFRRIDGVMSSVPAYRVSQ